MADNVKGLTFGQPPVRVAQSQVGTDWFAVAETLRESPGEWAKVDRPLSESSARSRASQIRKGKARGFEDGSFDARIDPVTSGKDKGKAHIWVTCISPENRGHGVSIAPEPQAEPEEPATPEDDGVPFA